MGPDEPAVAAAARAAGHRFACLPAAPFARQAPYGRLRALTLATLGAARRGRRLLRDEHATLVLGFGGYACGPAIVAARSLGIPVLLHEANATARDGPDEVRGVLSHARELGLRELIANAPAHWSVGLPFSSAPTVQPRRRRFRRHRLEVSKRDGWRRRTPRGGKLGHPHAPYRTGEVPRFGFEQSPQSAVLLVGFDREFTTTLCPLRRASRQRAATNGVA